MMNKEIIIFLCGLHSLFFAIFHVGFWKLLRWKTELKKVSLPNRAVMQMLNIQLIIVALFMAYLCFFFAKDLYSTNVGRAILGGMAVFWLVRLIGQFIFLRINNKTVHFVTALIVIGIILFLLPIL